MAVLLALTSAVFYGLSDFVGGLLSRRSPGWSVAVVAQLSSTVCTTIVALASGGDARWHDIAWGGLAGVGTGLGTAFLYRGLATGRMSVVAPLSALGAALLPVVVGLVSGERPSALTWVGVVVALPAIWLVSRAAEPLGEPAPDGSGVIDGLLAGMGFGVLFAALGQVPDGAGLFPLATAQAVSVLAVVALATVLRVGWVPRGRGSVRAVVVGPLGAAATLAFLLSTQHGLLSVAAVLSSLYPATTVVLAAVLLREHIDRAQGVGLALAAVSISLVAVG